MLGQRGVNKACCRIPLSYCHHQIGSMTHLPLLRVRSWNNGVCCMSFYILLAWISNLNAVHGGVITYHWLTHWGRVTHICVSKLTISGSDNGLSPGQRQAIIWTNDGILLIGPLGTYFSEILSGIHTFSLKKMHLKVSSGKCRPFCLGLNVIRHVITCPCPTSMDEASERRLHHTTKIYTNCE